jgi:RNA polymerase sigma-70 factor (ECF subfamily)
MSANTIEPLAVMQMGGMTRERGPAAERLEIVDPPDAELVARTCAGDARAFDALVRRHYRSAYAVALAQMGSRADAEDVCHDALVRAAERLEDCRTPERFAQWLCAIVRNHARNVLARNNVRRASSLEHETVASADDSARNAELSELRVRLEAALATLTPIQREVVLLHDLDGWTHDSIAESIGTSAGMSRQHLFHARKQLRALLGPGAKETLR